MPRASKETIQAVRTYVTDNPDDRDVAGIAQRFGVSPQTAQRAINPPVARAESVGTPSPVGDTGGRKTAADSAPRGPLPRPKARKRKGYREPSDDAVDSLYTVACMMTSVVLAAVPASYQLTETDREMILRPLSRIYLRRNSVPTLSPDAHDWLMVLTGVVGYGLHAVGGRYAGRDAERFTRAAYHAARAGTDAPAPGPVASPSPGVRPNGGNGQPFPAHAPSGNDYNPLDPQAQMDRLAEELARDKALRESAERATANTQPN